MSRPIATPFEDPIATPFEDDGDASSPTTTQFGGEGHIKDEVLIKKEVTDPERIIPLADARNEDDAKR